MVAPHSRPWCMGLLMGPGLVGLGAELLGGPVYSFPPTQEWRWAQGGPLTSSRIFFTVSPFWNRGSDKGGGHLGFCHRPGRPDTPALEARLGAGTGDPPNPPCTLVQGPGRRLGGPGPVDLTRLHA